MTGVAPSAPPTDRDDAIIRFALFLRWSSLAPGGRVARVLEIDERRVTWASPDGSTYATDLRTGESQRIGATRSGATVPVVRPPDFDGLPPAVEARSPDGSAHLTELDFDLAIRDIESGHLRRLTHSGTAARPWRVNAQVNTRVPTPPVWSPDGRSVFSIQVDIGQVPEYPLVDWMTSPIVVNSPRLATEGSGRATFSAAFIDVDAGKVTETELVGDGRTLIPLRWTEDGSAFLALLTIDAGTVDLVRIDARTGSVDLVTREDAAVLSAYIGPLLSGLHTPLAARGQVGWLSDADGAMRLYALDLATGLRTALTPPTAQVAQVVGTDTRGRVLLLARTDIDRPYDIHVCRTDLTGEFAVLTHEPGTHDAIPVEDGFVDIHSALTRPLRSELRGEDGGLRAVIEIADTRQAEALGRAEPLEFRVKADDGVTDLYGVIYLPIDFDPQRHYPVIDSIYGGPQRIANPNAWADPILPSGSPWVGVSNIAQAFAQLGFVGVVLDARGTPGRGREFQAAATQEFGTLGVRDHVAALRQLADRHPWLDIDRTGVIGLSFGGYSAARCGLLAPEVYKAVVAASGPYDLEIVMPSWYEGLLGTSFQENRQAFVSAGLVDHAAEFRPELLLIHGTADVNVTLAQTMRFSDALVRAGKHHELLILQNQSHQMSGQQAEFALLESARFFCRHLTP